MRSKLMQRWRGPGGGAEVLTLAAPLIISTGAHSIQMFVDRMFLMWHSRDAMSAAMQAGIIGFVAISLFMGTVGYANTFVAQYTGANRRRRVGPAVWQAIYLSFLGGVVIIGLIPVAETIFNSTGHDPAVRRLEITYFRIMCLAGGPVLMAASVSTFFTGRGKTWTVMIVNVVATIVNVVLDYGLIFGRLGFPRWGVAGAATATVVATVFSAVVFVGLFLQSRYRRRFATWAGRALDVDLFRRLIRYGLPNGIHFMLGILAFALFVVLVGRLNKIAMAATVMSFNINLLAFMPMIGFGIAVSTLVGQALGKNDAALAQRSTWSAFYMTMIYMTSIALGYWFFPELFLYPFASGADPSEFAPAASVARTLLCFVAFYCVFDTGNIIFAAALKGAGDTRFVMVVSVVLSWLVLVVPTYLAVTLGWGLYVAWGFMTAYVCILSATFFLRFLQGRWKHMRVIEPSPPIMPPQVPAVPAVEADVT